jgi:hypothetical protein
VAETHGRSFQWRATSLHDPQWAPKNCGLHLLIQLERPPDLDLNVLHKHTRVQQST